MKVLFLCGSNASLGRMAEQMMNARLPEGDMAVGAGVRAGRIRHEAINVMRKIGIDVSDVEIKAVGDLDQLNFDLMITLCDEAKEYSASFHEFESLGDASMHAVNAVFVGAPIHIHWPLDESIAELTEDSQSTRAFLKARNEIEKRIQILVDHEYFGALKEQRRRFDHLADLMEDGLIAHDDSRNIFLFNRKAEEITGLSRSEVFGRNCHDIFPSSGLCGAQCRFKDGPPTSTDKQEYEIVITDKLGVDKRLKMNALPFIIQENKPTGVLAVLRDMTEIRKLRLKEDAKHNFHGMIGVSKSMQNVFDSIRTVAASEYSVLISGESGVGKELAARAIHAESRRFGGPFVPVNCGALPESILESELFGHVRGAFTGAIRDKKGRFELADGGTLFLDEVGELPMSFQVKLLRVLQEQSFERVGGEKCISVDVRILSATNRDLRKMISEGRFREDLYYRLCVVPIDLPPLRKRPEGLPFLVDHILAEIKKDTDGKRITISGEAMNLLLRFDWPGNIRELKNALQFASIHCSKGEILPEHLPPEIRLNAEKPRYVEARSLPEGSSGSRRKKLKRESLKAALDNTKGNKLKAAKMLGVGRATLYRFLKEHPDLLAD